MAYLTIPRQPWDERMPNGRSSLMPRRDMMYRAGEDDEVPRINPLSTSPDRQSGVRVAFGPNGLSGVPSPSPPNPITEPLPESLTTMGRLPDNLDFHPYPQNATPSQKTATDIQARLGAAPRSPVIEVPGGVNVEPPKPKGHGFLNTLKNIGKGFAVNTAEYYRQHPNAGGLELLSAGAAGAGVGGFNPGYIDKQIAERAIRGKEADLEQQMGIEAGQAQLRGIQLKPELEAEKLRIEREVEQGRLSREETQRQIEQVKMAETARHNRETERIQEVRASRPPASPVDRTDIRQAGDRQRKRDAAVRELASHIEGEKNAAQLKDQKAEALRLLEAQDAAGDATLRDTLKPQLDRARKEYEDAQKLYESFGAKKISAQKDIDENTDTPKDPQVQRYADKFFGGDYAAAQAAIQQQRQK